MEQSIEMVINLNGDYNLSEKAYDFLGLKWDGKGTAYKHNRTNKDLIKCVERLGNLASGKNCTLEIVSIRKGVFDCLLSMARQRQGGFFIDLEWGNIKEEYRKPKKTVYREVVFNACGHGLNLSKEGYEFLDLNWDGIGNIDSLNISRDDPALIDCITALGEKADGKGTKCAIVSIPIDVKWEIKGVGEYVHIITD